MRCMLLVGLTYTDAERNPALGFSHTSSIKSRRSPRLLNLKVCVDHGAYRCELRHLAMLGALREILAAVGLRHDAISMHFADHPLSSHSIDRTT